MTEKEDEKFWQLLGKRVAGEITEEENLELNSQLENHPEVLDTLKTVGNYWNSLKENAEHKVRESALERHLLRMKELKLITYDKDGTGKTTSKSVRKKLVYYSRIAVAAAIFVFVSLIVFFYLNKKETKVAATKSPLLETIVALKGSKNHFVLPDGSRVWLNASTTISYMTSFNADSAREVFLTGEAYFEIMHNEKHPFYIHTSQVDIRDIGTSFNVKAYPADTVTETTLIEGSIQVRIKNGKQVTTLSRPNEKVTVYSSLKNDSVLVNEKKNKPETAIPLNQTLKVSTEISYVRDDSLLAETAWLNGVMVFRNETFEQLAGRLERWYNVTISFEKSEYRKYRFSGTFRNETIEQALKELQAIKPFSFSMNDSNVVIK